MMWKTIFVAMFIVGVLADNELLELCRKNGAEDKVEAVQKTMDDYGECLGRLADSKAIRKEISEAIPNGSVKEVLKKHCAKSDELKTCIRDLYTGIAPCLSQSVRDKLPAASDAGVEAVDYICYDDGSRVVSFVADGGHQCTQDKAGAIAECTQKATDSVSQSSPDISFRLNFIQEGCNVLGESKNCIVTALKGCPTTSAANLAEALLTFLSRSNACTE